jgi:uncharacterized membrane protein
MTKNLLSLNSTQALLSSVCLSLVFILLRVILSTDWFFIFLIWNLFLAAIPLFLSQLLLNPRLQKLPSFAPWAIAVLWLGFFPNAPYLITDLFHLRHDDLIPIWFDTILLFSCAWNGLILSLASLLNIHRWLTTKFSSLYSWLAVGFIIFASSFGIYLGRFVRWNTWDLVTNPGLILHDILTLFSQPESLTKVTAFTVAFGLFLGVSYLCFLSVATEKNSSET